MFIELFATLVGGLGGAGLVMLLRHLSGGRLPRWLVPTGAGAAMLAVTIANEYGWYPRLKAALPDSFAVAESVAQSQPWRPWTYLAPITLRFVAVDMASLRRHPERPGEVIGDVYFYGRWAPLRRISVLFDCAGRRRAALSVDAQFDATGAVIDPPWVRVAPDDALLAVVCAPAPAPGAGAS